jgi:hypothetical protein
MKTNHLNRTIIALCLPFMVSICIQRANAQVYLKSTLIGPSKYSDSHTADTNSKGSAYVIRGGLQLPLSVTADTLVSGSDTISSQTVWAVRFDGSHTRFENQNMDQHGFPASVYNYRLGIVYLHTLNKKWTVWSTLGAGLYTSSSGITARQVIGEGSVIFVRNITPNLKVGAGLAFDNTFGFPMVYPGLIVDWAIDGKGGKYFARLNSNEIKAGIKYSENFQLYLNFDVFGASALYKDNMFTHMYYGIGVTPEFKVGKYFSIPVTLGMTASRNMYSNDRNVKDFFSYLGKDDVPHFAPSPFVSVGITYGM